LLLASLTPAQKARSGRAWRDPALAWPAPVAQLVRLMVIVTDLLAVGAQLKVVVALIIVDIIVG